MFRRIRTNFLTGLIVIIPLVITIWFFYFIINKFNAMLLEPIMDILEQWLHGQNIEFLTKTAILFLLVFIITLIGLATRVIILRNIFGFGERILYRVPMVSTIYKGLKEMSVAFLAHENSIFKKVVLVEYPRKGLYAVGFVTSEIQGEAQIKTNQKSIAVFLPTAPNPTSGMFVLVPQQEVIYLDMSVADGMKMIISGGAVAPKISG